jgi:hypothetical protein
MSLQSRRRSVFVQQLKLGFLIASVLSLALLSTALVPNMKGLATVSRMEVRPAHAPAAVHAVPIVVSGELSVVNYLHRAVSVRGILADQAYRLFAALVFLAIYSLRTLSRSRTVRCGLAAFSLLGAAGCLSDFLSYWTIGGVVDWIGVNGHSAFAPSDLCFALAPIGTFLAATLGLTTFSPWRREGESIAHPRWRIELSMGAEMAMDGSRPVACLD